MRKSKGGNQKGTEASGQNAEIKNKIEEKTGFDSAFKRLPIIAMTAHAMMGDREKSMAAGMDDHVAKPIDTDELFTVLEKWIPPKTDRPGSVPTDTENAGDASVESSDQTSSLPGIHTENDELPFSLPGFDLEAGLKRLQGNRKLYRKLLLDFGNDYKKASENIHKALIANDIKQVHSLVHNIKGLAGNLSAVKLQEAAANMDGSVKKALSAGELEQGYFDSIFAELKTALGEALAACQTLAGPEDEKTDISDEASADSLPPDLARRTAERIQSAVDMGNISDLKLVAEELKTKSNSYAGISAKITQLANDFDFDEILKLATELESLARRENR